MDEVFVSAKVGIRLMGSHGFDMPGFTSAKYGVFVSYPIAPSDFVDSVTLGEIDLLGVRLSSFEIKSAQVDRPGAWQTLEIVFDPALTEDAIKKLLDDLSVGLTMKLAPRQVDGWYGNLVVQFNWSSLELKKVPSDMDCIQVGIWSNITSKEHELINPDKLSGLNTSQFAEIFVDGMRANHPKLKYLNWFLPIEELETRAADEFAHLFTPVFPKINREEIVKASGLAGRQLERFRNFVGNPNHTLENRAEKLFAILEEISITEVVAIGDKKINIDLEICEKLIKGRNSLAHRGFSVDTDMLYSVLFPLSYKVVQFLSN